MIQLLEILFMVLQVLSFAALVVPEQALQLSLLSFHSGHVFDGFSSPLDLRFLLTLAVLSQFSHLMGNSKTNSRVVS